MRKHPTDLRLENLYLIQSEEDREILLHLGTCLRCQSRFSGIARHQSDGRIIEDPEPPPPLRGPALAFAAVLALERTEAPELFVGLLRQPAQERERLLRDEPRLRTLGLAELLIERSLETATRDPRHAEDLCQMALRLTDLLDADLYGTGLLEDLRARAWAYIGNARRVRSSLRAAERAFARAAAHLRQGTGDPLETAVQVDLQASLRKDQRLFKDAIELSQQAIEIFLHHGEPHRAGRSLIKLSTIRHLTGEIEDAMSDIRQSLDLLDAEQEPRLLLCAQHNLTFYLTEIGRFEEAREAYRRTRPLYRDFAEPWVQNRRRWVRGRILGGLGHPDLAEQLLRAARDGFLGEGIPYDTALVSLDLATLYARQGRNAELKRLAGEMLPIFASLHIHREALAALTYLCRAIGSEKVGAGVVAAVAEFLKRAQHRPELRFEAPE